MGFCFGTVLFFVFLIGLPEHSKFVSGSQDEAPEAVEVCGDLRWTAKCVQKKNKDLCHTEDMKLKCQKTCGYCVDEENADTKKIDDNKKKENEINEESCGKTVVPASRVVAGMDAGPGEWPWQVWLNIEGPGFSCGGSLIARDWVLTAAHCILEDDRRLYQVVIGDLNQKKIEGSEQVFDVKRILKHKFYNKPEALTNDVALLQLSRPAVLNNFVNTVCLPKYKDKVKPGKRCFVSGWGMTHTPGAPATILQQASLPVVSNEKCSKMKLDQAKANNETDVPTYAEITPAMLCAGDAGKTKKSACFGDSGGPFVCRNSAGRWVLQGVVSWGDRSCSSKMHYSVFARVSMFRRWIEDNLKRYSD